MTDPVFLTSGPRPAVRVQRRYDHPVDRVWRAVTTSEGLGAWFPSGVELDLVPGGAVRYGDFDGAAAHGQVVAVEPPARLELTWGGDRLTFELRADGGGTVFSLTHEFDDRYGAASFASGWERCLAALADEPRDPSDRAVARHEELVVRFGLDQPDVTRSAGAWRARFERQLTCPAEAAWELFFAGAPAPAVGEEFRPAGAPEVVLGTVTAVEPPRAFAFDVAPDEPGERVSLRLGEGTGHGARLILEVSGREPGELDAAVDQWGGGAIAHVAREAAYAAAATSAPTK